MKKELKIGENYAEIFGLDKKAGDRIVFLGGIKFEMHGHKTGITAEKESQKTYDSILEYISRAGIQMGW